MAGRASFGYISEPEFASLLDTLCATAKGRTFLAEYRRRTLPEDTLALLDSVGRIESVIAEASDQLQPARLGADLLRLAMALEIALDDAGADPEGDDTARRFALIERTRRDLVALAASLTQGGASPIAAEAEEIGDER